MRLVIKAVVVQLTLLLICLTLTDVHAQDQSDESDDAIVVVSYFKCGLDAIPEVAQMTRELTKPILDRLVREEMLLGWGALTHYWGDEWNYIVYYNATDLGAFETAFTEFVESMMEESPDWMSNWSSLCTEHKDNIYSVVTGYNME